jgi:UDP-N-acetylmuramoyl-L-alanyl-D-glutamate--2,6-diaminopimelate ligase
MIGFALRDLAAALPGARLHGEGDTLVRGAFQDSRRVVPGSVFVVRRGAKSDGRAFVADAVARGAAALVVDDAELAASAGLPTLWVPDARAVIGPLALAAYGHPERALAIVGVTGTNGKTTTTHLTRALLDATGHRAAVLGTLGCFFGELELPATHTTPEGDDTARALAAVVERGGSHLVMEVSSHALALDRVDALPFEVAAFTNLTQDHLDFHGTMEAYGAAKARLFVELAPRHAVICVDAPFGAALGQRAKGEVLRVSATGLPAELAASDVRIDATGLSATVNLRGELRELRSPLVGAHNLENLLVALGIGLASGVSFDAGLAALRTAPPVPGRLERCSEPGDEVLVVVDYAHTPDALARVLAALRPLTSGRLHCLFGCGGDRDPHKRPLMGAAAARGADALVVTNDNPRSEEPALIAAAIERGIAAEGAPFVTILDRAEAIAYAIAKAQPGDTVLVAGKGHEPYQIVGDLVRPFDDRVEARRALGARARRDHP